MTTPWYIISALVISAIALFVAAKNYLRKAGIKVRGTYCIASSRDCNDKYVSTIILENLKDRAVTIFTIYLRVGHSYYIQIEDFEDRPLILRAFETYQKDFGPIQFYGINNNRINLNHLLDEKNIKKRLVLSTADGKYVVPSQIIGWNPYVDFFRNHLTAIVRPVRTIYKEKYLGANIKFVVEFVGDNNALEIVPIHPDDFQLKIFRNFRLTPESLDSQVSLTEFLNTQMEIGTLACKSFSVHDIQTWKARAAEFYTGKTLEAKYYSLLKYHIGGRLLTMYSDRKLKRENKRRCTYKTPNKINAADR